MTKKERMKKFSKHLVKYITHVNMAKQKKTTQEVMLLKETLTRQGFPDNEQVD